MDTEGSRKKSLMKGHQTTRREEETQARRIQRAWYPSPDTEVRTHRTAVNTKAHSDTQTKINSAFEETSRPQ